MITADFPLILLLSDERTGEELVKTPALSMEMQKKAVVPQIEKNQEIIRCAQTVRSKQNE